MPFNANTYRMNRYRRKAWDELREARAIRERVATGIAYPWENERIAFLVRMARLSMRLHLSCRAMRQLE